MRGCSCRRSPSLPSASTSARARFFPPSPVPPPSRQRLFLSRGSHPQPPSPALPQARRRSVAGGAIDTAREIEGRRREKDTPFSRIHTLTQRARRASSANPQLPHGRGLAASPILATLTGFVQRVAGTKEETGRVAETKSDLWEGRNRGGVAGGGR